MKRISGTCFCPTSHLAAAAFVATSFLPAAAQPIFNGEHTLISEERFYAPASIHSAVGEGEDANVTLISTWITSGGDTVDPGTIGALFADSNGTGTHNTAIWNMDSSSMLQIVLDHDGLGNVFGYDGTTEINVDGTAEPFFRPAGNLRTRRVSLAVLPGSAATVNLVGPHAVWDAWERHIDLGIGGVGTINIKDGAQMIEVQRLAVGGTRWFEGDGQVIDGTTGEEIRPPYVVETDGTGILNVDGEGSRLQWSNHSQGVLYIGRRSTGVLTVSNGGLVDLADNTVASGINVYVGDLAGGNGSLIVEDGGIVNSSGILRVYHRSSDGGYIRVDGPGSELNAGSAPSLNFLGNRPVGPGGAPEGSKGHLEIVNGGKASIGPDLRMANQTDSRGEVTIDGAGSHLNVPNFLQVAFSGVGELTITNGGKLTAGLEGSGNSSIGRASTGHGTMVVDGPGSVATYGNSLFIATSTNAIGSAGTGTGVLAVKNEGLVEVGNDLAVRGNGSILLDGGTIRLTGSGIASLSGENTLLAGEGVLDADLLLANDAMVQGSGTGILVTGILSGSGALENVTLGGVDLQAGGGLLVLNHTRFVGNSPLNVMIDALEQTHGQITFDEETDFSGTNLTVNFEPFEPDQDVTFSLFNYTGPGTAEYNFASVTVPEGWELRDGVLLHTDGEAEPPSGSFADWADFYGLSGLDAEPDANPGGDGHSNLKKFAFGVNPNHTVPLLVDLVRDGDSLTLRWNRRASGIDYAIQNTAILDGWAVVADAVPGVMPVPDVTPPEGYERVEWSVNIAGEGDRSFYRVIGEVDPGLLP